MQAEEILRVSLSALSKTYTFHLTTMTILKKTIFTISLLILFNMTAWAQVLSWHDPMRSGAPRLWGRAWNEEIEKEYARLPERLCALMPAKVKEQSKNTAGLSVRFVSASSVIQVKYTLAERTCPPNMSLLNQAGVDLYATDAEGRKRWIGNHMQWNFDKDTITISYNGLNTEIYPGGELNFELYLPPYSVVTSLRIGISQNASFRFLKPGEERPVVIYGSSIVQGASPSRPGLMWTNLLGRMSGLPMVNLGFSGACLMEPEVFKAMAEVNARCFIIDPIPDSYRLTDEEIIGRVREGVRILRQRSLAPILLSESYPQADRYFYPAAEDSMRAANKALHRAFDSLRKEEVENLYYQSSETIALPEESMVEGTHLNDIGNKAYARAYIRQLQVMLPNDFPYTTVVFDNAHSPVPFRIPALTATRDGRLLAACDYRINRADVGWNHRNGLWEVDVVMKQSRDRGLTWGDSACVARGDEHAADTVHTAFGDASLVADRTSDEVLLHCVAGKVSYQRATRRNPQHAVFFHSFDGGRTWNQGTDLTEPIYTLYDGKLPNGGNADGIFLTSGKIAQSRYVKKGKYYRLYIAHPVRQENVSRCGTFVIYSDDFGRTWQVLGSPSKAPSIAQDEAKVDELPDGRVLLSCRDMEGGRRYNVFTYSNARKAKGSWGTEVMPYNMTSKEVSACNGDLLIVPATRRVDGKSVHVALQSVPLSARRDSLGFFFKELASVNDYATAEQLGRGWRKGLCLTSESSCYSTMVLMDNRCLGILYEVRGKNDGYDIAFSSLPLWRITNGQYETR